MARGSPRNQSPAVYGDGGGVQNVASRISQYWQRQYWKRFTAVLRVNPSEALLTTWAVAMEMPESVAAMDGTELSEAWIRVATMILMMPDSVSLLRAMVECVPDELYPPNVLPVPDRIHGTAFFPGGVGLHLENREPDELRFPFGGVMILGHNFDSEAGFKASLERGKEKLTSGTWGSLLPMLNAAEIPLGECFFTNAFMGLCAGSDSLGYEGRKDGAFRSACLRFLMVQISFQCPRLIVALGLHVPPMLAKLSPDLSCWTGPTVRLTDLDTSPIRNATIELGDGKVHRTVVVPIAHPSLPNGGRRTPQGFSPGKRGEIELIRAGWNAAVQC